MSLEENGVLRVMSDEEKFTGVYVLLESILEEFPLLGIEFGEIVQNGFVESPANCVVISNFPLICQLRTNL